MDARNPIDGIDYGPLACLVGTWTGDKGTDIAPDPAGAEENPYYETLLFEAIGDVTNANTQRLAVLRYHQVVSRKSDRKVFHNETGYWMWDAATGVVMHALTIPRGVCVLAGGRAAPGADGTTVLEVQASCDGKDWGIVQSPFMRDKARTVGFSHTVTVKGDAISYTETAVVEIYGKTFDHTDANTLTRLKAR